MYAYIYLCIRIAFLNISLFHWPCYSLEFDVDQSDPNDTGSKFIRFGGNRSKSVSSIKFGYVIPL